MVKVVYIIAHKNHEDFAIERGYDIYFHAGMTDGVFDTTYDVTKATRFNSRDELFDFLKNYCYFDRTIIREFTEEYLDKIKDNEGIKHRLCSIDSL